MFIPFNVSLFLKLIMFETLAQDHQLGSQIATFGWNPKRHQTLLLWWGLGLLLSPLTVVLLFIPGFVCLYGLVQCIARLRSHQPIVYLYEHGFIDARKGRPTVALYRDIESIKIDITNLSEFYRLQLKNGRRLTFGLAVNNLRACGNLLQEKMIEQQLPEMLQRLRDNDSIRFGPLTVTQSGLMRGKDLLPWQDLVTAQAVSQKLGKSRHVYLEISARHLTRPWAMIRRVYFPNPNLFISLIHHFKTAYV